jgi:hypothetical protein
MLTFSRSKYRQLLDDPNFRRWYENVARRSLATAQEWFRRRGRVRDRFGVAPERIAKMSQREASDFLLDGVEALDTEGKSGNYIANIVRPLKCEETRCKFRGDVYCESVITSYPLKRCYKK